jgi:hypothetical protein
MPKLSNIFVELRRRRVFRVAGMYILGVWIADVRAFAARQQRRLALDTLAAAIDDGWRVLSWYFLEHDPNLNSIRDEPEFRKLRQVLQDDMAAQARRVEQMKASGELTLIQ